MKIAYIDRQATDRRLTDQAHEELLLLLNMMQSEGMITFSHLLMETMKPVDQVKAVTDVSVRDHR